MKNGVQLITYPDSLGGNLDTLNKLMRKHFSKLFSGIHILPFYPSSGDRGFSPLTYFEVEPSFGKWENVSTLGKTYDILADIMVNHISRKSEYFQSFLEHGENSQYADFFITLDKIWDNGKAVKSDIDKMFLRRETPYSTYETPKGDEVTVWTTFGKENPSEQVDLDVKSEKVKDFISKVLHYFKEENINIVRLDAVGYVVKKLGSSCFFVEPEIWGFLDWINSIAKSLGIILLPEIHSDYKIQYTLAAKGYWIYDFILPYRILEALETKSSANITQYLRTRPHNQFTMIDCHDGIPVKPDLDGLVESEDAKKIVDVCLSRGANLSKIVSDKHKSKDGFDVHQIRGTIYSLLNCNDNAYIAARALQLFTPGIPQIYYVGLLAGENDLVAVEKTGEGREVNRHNYSLDEIENALEKEVVIRLMKLIEFRNNHEAFSGTFEVSETDDSSISILWSNEKSYAKLKINLKKNETIIEHTNESLEIVRYFA